MPCSYPDDPASKHENQWIWRLRENLTGYAATYVALAGALESPLLTADARLVPARVNAVR